ncbi:hypothetical protein WMF31_09790 [Sorangium sp. So ce1036]|uniref:hypothetical protein n=1 Tax=Sorangium sp. So ce1036 TaxID=3133328 RepID=UPI003EFEA85E
MLAAQCAETAIEVRQPLRKELERRVAKLVPPTSPTELQVLVNLGAAAGPTLLRKLEKASTVGKARIMNTLRSIAYRHRDYEHTTNAAIRLMKDSTPIDRSTPTRSAATPPAPTTLAEHAAGVAAEMVNFSDAAFSAIHATMPGADPSAVKMLRALVKSAKGSEGRERLQALIEHYEAAHAPAGPASAVAAARSPRRTARSG